jgi:hypothetical protein
VAVRLDVDEGNRVAVRLDVDEGSRVAVLGAGTVEVGALVAVGVESGV